MTHVLSEHISWLILCTHPITLKNIPTWASGFGASMGGQGEVSENNRMIKVRDAWGRQYMGQVWWEGSDSHAAVKDGSVAPMEAEALRGSCRARSNTKVLQDLTPTQTDRTNYSLFYAAVLTGSPSPRGGKSVWKLLSHSTIFLEKIYHFSSNSTKHETCDCWYRA